MPDLSTPPASAQPTPAPRTNARSQGAAGASSPDAASSPFLGQLQQSLGGPNAAGTGSPSTDSPSTGAVDPAQTQLVGPPAIPTDPSISTGKAAASTPASPASGTEKKTAGQSRLSPAGRAPDADDITPAQEPTPTALTVMIGQEPQSATGPEDTPPQPGQFSPNGDDTPPASQSGAITAIPSPKSAAEAATPSSAATTADNRRAKGKSDTAASSTDSTSSIAEAKILPDPTAHAAVATTAPTPNPTPPPQKPAQKTAENDTPPPTARSAAAAAPLGSAELRRTRLTAADPEEPSPAAPTEPTNLLAPTTAAAPPTPASMPHPAAAASLQPAPLSSPQASSSAPPPPPAVQVAQAVAEPVRVALAAPPQQSGGPHVTTIQLDPVELGRVEIRIERTNDGPAKIDLAAQRPDTLLRLVHDQAQLHQALDQAGIPQQGRTVTFSLATDSGSAGSSFTNFTGDGGFNNNGQRSHQGYGNPRAGSVDTIDSTGPAPVWSRAGLNITA